jgi:hypothetical protein
MSVIDWLLDSDPSIRWLPSRSRREARGSHEGEGQFAMDEGVGKPSRWNTLRALRVLRWAGIG